MNKELVEIVVNKSFVELSMNEKISVKTFESRNMHHVIIRDHIAHYFINALHTLIENYYETSS